MENSTTARIPHDFEGFRQYVSEHDYPVYIFGADIVGKVLVEVLRLSHITVEGYFDNNKNKCDQMIADVWVNHASGLPSINKNAIVLIASTYIADIIAQLEEQGFTNWIPVYQILEDKRDLQLDKLLEGSLRLNHSGGEFTRDFDSFVISNMINSQKKYLDTEKLYIRSVDLIITEKCSLKCKDCSNLMQFYEQPVNIALDELCQDLDDLCAIADEINEIRIIGGDPFMNKACHTVVKHAASYPQVNKVVVYTNGTICPPEDKLVDMVNDKTFVFITTYGDLSRNASKLSERLDKLGIPYNNQPAYGWTDCGDIKAYDRNEEEMRQIFRYCCAKHFTTLTDGKIFRCPFAANAERLHAMPDNEENYVSISGVAKNPELLIERRKQLAFYLRDAAYIPACNFCNGRTYGDPEIEPGIQTKDAIPYKKYDRVIEIKAITS